MKSILIATFILIGISLPTMAQVGEMRNNFAVGINLGGNYNNASFNYTVSPSLPTIKQKGLLGITGGITARYISEKYFAMICGAQVELNYSQRGWDELIEDGSNNTYTRHMDYLEIPFLAHLAFGKDRGAQFFLNLGPQIGFLLSDKEVQGGDAWNPSGRVHEQYGKKIENAFDYGIAGGAGLEIRTKAGNFLLEGRYYFGLADFYNSTKKDFFARSAHTTISARITYLFDIRK